MKMEKENIRDEVNKQLKDALETINEIKDAKLKLQYLEKVADIHEKINR